MAIGRGGGGRGASVREFDAIPLSEEERLKLYELNSRRVFRLDGPLG
jgi:hypothetical protein